MAITVDLIELDATPTVEVRSRTAVGQLPPLIGRNYGLLYSYLTGIGVAPTGVPFTVYHNSDMANLDVSMGFPVPPGVSGSDEITASEIPAGPAAACEYVGPYAQMTGAYDTLFRWIGEHGYEPTGPIYEFYLNSPDQVPESELRTRIVAPLRRA